MESLGDIHREIGTNDAEIKRTSTGRPRGRKGGRKGPTAEQLDQLKRYTLIEDKYGSPLYSIPNICGFMKISRNTYYRWLRFMKEVDNKDIKV